MVWKRFLPPLPIPKLSPEIYIRWTCSLPIFHADIFSTYQLSSLLTLYLCRYISFPIFSIVYHFITSLHHWKTVRIHKPRSIIFTVFSGSMATNWFCGHCSFGPMMIETTESCVMCYRQRDSYAMYENLEPPFTASLNQPEPRFSAAHCGNRGPITYQQPKPELGARGLAVQEKALTPTRWYCCHGKNFKNVYHCCFFRANCRRRWRWSRVPQHENEAFELRSRKLPRILQGPIELHTPLAKVSRLYWNAYFRIELMNWPMHVENSWHNDSIFPFMRLRFLSSRHHLVWGLLAFIAVLSLGFCLFNCILPIFLYLFFFPPCNTTVFPHGPQPWSLDYHDLIHHFNKNF